MIEVSAGRVRFGRPAARSAVRRGAQCLDRARVPLAAGLDSGKTLAEKLADGDVEIGPAVRIGRFCEIHPGVRISESNLDDDIEVHRDAVIERSQIRDGAIVGPHAYLREAVIGSMSEIRSEPFHPTTIDGMVALGDEVTVYAGVHIERTSPSTRG